MARFLSFLTSPQTNKIEELKDDKLLNKTESDLFETLNVIGAQYAMYSGFTKDSKEDLDKCEKDTILITSKILEYLLKRELIDVRYLDKIIEKYIDNIESENSNVIGSIQNNSDDDELKLDIEKLNSDGINNYDVDDNSKNDDMDDDDMDDDMGDGRNDDMGDGRNDDMGDGRNDDMGDGRNDDMGDGRNDDMGDGRNDDMGEGRNDDINKPINYDKRIDNVKDTELINKNPPAPNAPIPILNQLPIPTNNESPNQAGGVEIDKKAPIIQKKFLRVPSNINLIETDKEKKRSICIGIAEYYYTIAKLVKVIHEVLYSTGEFDDKKGSKDNRFNGVCRRRLNILFSLKRGLSGNMLDGRTLIQKEGCKNPQILNDTDFEKLDELYYDDYDLEKGEFNKMTEKTKKQYKKDVENMLNGFSKNLNITNEEKDKIKSFNDIAKLLTTKTFNFKHCNEQYTKKDKEFLNINPFKSNNSAVKKFTDKYSKMYEKELKMNNELMDILNKQIFVIVEKENSKNLLSLQPGLTKKKVLSIIEDLKKKLNNYYIECNNDFNETINAYNDLILKIFQRASEEKEKSLLARIKTKIDNNRKAQEEKKEEEAKQEEKEEEGKQEDVLEI